MAKIKNPPDISKNLFLILALRSVLCNKALLFQINVGLKSKDCKPLKENHLLHHCSLLRLCSEWK